MWYVYILKCEDGSLYTGITTDLERRFLEHKNQKGGHYTSSHAVVERVYSQTFPDRSTASKREAQIKKLKREEKIALIQSTMSA